MNHKTISLIFVLATFLAACQSTLQTNDVNGDVVEQLQDQALSSDLAFEILASLTSEVGPRMGGSEGDKLAVKWAIEQMRNLGFDRVWTEPVNFPQWLRKSESAQALVVRKPKDPDVLKWMEDRSIKIEPSVYDLAVTALGGSPSTNGEIEAELLQFDTLEALEAATTEEVTGKIVFLSTRMRRSRDGAGYGETVVNRSRGPFVAASKGAVALLIRSVGTDNNRLPHTGMISGTEEGEPVPSAAVSNPDADNLMMFLSGKEPVNIRLNLDVGFEEEITSFNVVGEFDGRDDVTEFVMLGAHLDSWDLGTGAVDDGAGVALVMAAAKLVADLPSRPQYGIRVVLFANEEQGIYGGKTYAKLHQVELGSHLVGAESDFGADRIYQFRTRVLPEAEPEMQKLAGYLERLGIERDLEKPAGGGADIGQMRKIGLAAIDLRQDGSRYFDWHHTANDTLDKVEPENLQHNLAAWVTLTYLTADTKTGFGPVEPSE